MRFYVYVISHPRFTLLFLHIPSFPVIFVFASAWLRPSVQKPCLIIVVNISILVVILNSINEPVKSVVYFLELDTFPIPIASNQTTIMSKISFSASLHLWGALLYFLASGMTGSNIHISDAGQYSFISLQEPFCHRSVYLASLYNIFAFNFLS